MPKDMTDPDTLQSTFTRQAETTLQESIEHMRKLSSVVEQSADSVIITDIHAVIEYVNTAFETITGYSREEAIGSKPNLVKSGLHDDEFFTHMWQTILKGEMFCDVFMNRKKNGKTYYEEKTITPLWDNKGEKITHFISTGKDITLQVQANARLKQLAYYDDLTSLPNRTLLTERIKYALSRLKGQEGKLAILVIGLDRFKMVNDTLGYEVGDALLRTQAERLCELVQPEDTVAHFGGDKFIILLESAQSLKDIPKFAEVVLEKLTEPFSHDEHELFCTAGVGISMYPDDGADVSSLLQSAERAMYNAKSSGPSAYQFYTADMNTSALKRLSMEAGLRRAIKREEFQLYYQPQVALTTGSIMGMEALLRWKHPQWGMVSPVDFMPLLEETGLIVSVGQWVLERACEDLYSWQQAGWPSLRMAVNLSTLEFQQKGLPKIISSALAHSGLASGSLEIELTEGIVMHNLSSAITILRTLRQMGLRLVMDDFGTGYSSLSHLKRLPLHVLKLDKSFVLGVPHDPSDVGITRAVITVAHSLGLEVVAEGVENEEQIAFLHNEQCDIIQGYLFSRPLIAEDIPELLASGKRI